MTEKKWTKLFVGSLNDGLFIIDTPPHPSPVDYLTPSNPDTRVIAKVFDREYAQVLASAPDLYEALDRLRGAAQLMHSSLVEGMRIRGALDEHAPPQWLVDCQRDIEAGGAALAKARGET